MPLNKEPKPKQILALKIHNRLAIEMNRCLEEIDMPEWMTKGKTTLFQKSPKKELPQTTINP